MGKSARTVFALAIASLLAGTANSQSMPPRTTIINPFAAGTTTDTVARVVADGLHRKFGTTFIVDSKPGAGGMIGTGQVARSPADGSVIGVSIAGPLVHNTILYKKMAYDPDKELTPLTLAVHQPCLLVASKSIGVNTIPALVDLLKKNPGKYNYGYVGNGSLGHLIMAMLANKSGTQIVPILYPGAAQAMTAVISGDVQLGCLPAQGAIGQVKGGTVVPLAVSSAKRSPLLADLPSLSEFYPDISGSAWIGFVAPANTPPALAQQFSSAIGEVLHEPQAAQLLRQQFMEVETQSPSEFKAFMAAERARWKPVIEANQITAE